MAWKHLLLPLLALSSCQVYADPDCSEDPGSDTGPAAPQSGSTPVDSGPSKPVYSLAPGSSSGFAEGLEICTDSSDTDYSQFYPVDAVPSSIKEFNLHVTWDEGAPDGVTRMMFKINDTYPGPVLKVNQGDHVLVQVYNESPKSISIHWHGLDQVDSPWSDGVPGLTQLPIAPGDTFIYTFFAHQYGCFPYHAHEKEQIADGMSGVICIIPYHNHPRPFFMIDNSTEAIEAMILAEQNPVVMHTTDWTHFTSEERQAATEASQIECVCEQSILFNGFGRVVCPDVEEVQALASPGMQAILGLIPGSNLTDFGCVSAENLAFLSGGAGTNVSAIPPGMFSGCTPTNTDLEVINVALGQWVVIQLVNIANVISPYFSIDEHEMYIFAMDGAYVEPQKVDTVQVLNAQRYSIMIFTDKPGDFHISMRDSAAIQVLSGYAVLHVEGTNGTSLSDATPFVDAAGNPVGADVAIFDERKAHPFPSSPIPDADTTIILNLTLLGSYHWALNNTPNNITRLEGVDPPTLFTVPDPSPHDNITIVTIFDEWVDYVCMSGQPLSHPLHWHGETGYLIGSGVGDFIWSSVAEAIKDVPDAFNLVDPPKRDTIGTLASPAPGTNTWTIVRRPSGIRAAFMLHCHIDSHMTNGMMITILEALDQWPTLEIPVYYQLKANGTL